MRIAPGSKLGPYEVLSLLGAGGMGEVYRARDPRLGRDVAIKVLPAERMADEGRRQRFTQEARAASSLNHPNIVTIYEIECEDGIDIIVMEYVPGQTLDGLIPKSGMRLSDVLRTTIQIADAVAAAHAKGIVHRDLKPANVAVTREGVVKVLDFGLAKLVADETSDDGETQSTVSVAAAFSQPGRITGTAGYLSPEQATGGKADARSDVFSFGALLYEMVTGRRAFAGKTVSETLAAVVRDQPKAPSELAAGVPRDLEKLILRCLRKEPERRFHHMVDVKVALEEIKEESESGGATAAVPLRSERRLRLAAGLATILVAAAGAWLLLRSASPPPQLLPLTTMRGPESGPSLSPDGDQVAFSWSGEKLDNVDVYIKMVGSSEVRRLTTDPLPDLAPSWSPDGRQIAFVRLGPQGSTLHLVSPLGGPDRKLGSFLAAMGAPSWSPDSRFVVAARTSPFASAASGSEGLYLLPVEGGEPRPIELPQATGSAFMPKVSPDGRRLAFQACIGFACHVDVVDLGADFVTKGPPRRLTRRAIKTWGGLAWTRDGRSVLFVESGFSRLWRVGVDGTPPVPVELAGLKAMLPSAAVSRDRLVFTRLLTDGDIYRFEAGRPAEPVLSSSFDDYWPQFSPDGRRIAFESERSGDGHDVWLAEADGTNAVQLTRGPGLFQGSPRWSPDGARIAFDSQGEDGMWDIWTIDVEGGSPRRLSQGPGNEHNPSWSRDGRFVYFTATRGGSPPDVWRIPAEGGAEERVTHGGGATAQESLDGRTLFFMQRFPEAPLLALPLAGGAQRQVAACVSAFGVGPGAVYYLGCRVDPRSPPMLGRPEPFRSLVAQDLATGRERLLGNLERAEAAGLTVAPDGRAVLFTKVIGEGSDLMMIENFR